MKFNIGMAIAITAALIFNLRLIIIQREKTKKFQNKKRWKTDNELLPKTNNKPVSQYLGLEFRHPVLLILGILFVLLGAGLSALPGISLTLSNLWWIPVTIGILTMSFSIK